MCVHKILALLTATLALSGCSVLSGAGESRNNYGPLALERFGQFMVGGERRPYASDARAARDAIAVENRTQMFGQARVTYLIPEGDAFKVPVVMYPGYGLTSSIYLSTPDGRPGWAELFARLGHPVYVLDEPNRAASRLSIDEINACIIAGRNAETDARSAVAACNRAAPLSISSIENPWGIWGMGPTYGETFADNRFPVERWNDQFAPAFDVGHEFAGNTDADEFGAALEIPPLLDLLDRIGPAIFVLHSAAGATGYRLAQEHPERVAGLVAIETVYCPSPDKVSARFGEIPFLGVWGDHLAERTAGEHPGRLASCMRLLPVLSNGKIIRLPEDMGIRGNTHMMMQDRNNDVLARIVSDWIKENVEHPLKAQ